MQSVTALYLLLELFWAMNRTSCTCPSLFILGPKSQLTWKCIDVECQSTRNFTECFKVNISDFDFCSSCKIVLKNSYFEESQNKRDPDQCLLFTMIFICLKPGQLLTLK